MKKWNTVWITGASSGIGYELSKLLSNEASYVAVSARRQKKLEELDDAYNNIHSHELDVTDEEKIKFCILDRIFLHPSIKSEIYTCLVLSIEKVRINVSNILILRPSFFSLTVFISSIIQYFLHLSISFPFLFLLAIISSLFCTIYHLMGKTDYFKHKQTTL